MSRVAIIDMGTNTFHLLVADVNADKPHILFNEKIPTRVGVGGINTGIIRPQAWERAMQALRQFVSVARSFDVKRTVAFGTSAIRNARNAPELMQQIQEELLIETVVLDGAQEAAYIALGVQAAISMGSAKHLIMDIGGGSVEFIIADGSTLFWAQSFEIGGQRLLEKFKLHEPILASELQQLDKYFDLHLASLAKAIQQFQPAYVAGSSGSFDTLSEIYCLEMGMAYDPVQGQTPFSISFFEKIYSIIISANRGQRMQIPGMIDMRVDMIVVACRLIHYVLRMHNFADIKVSSFSLKEGALFSLGSDTLS